MIDAEHRYKTYDQELLAIVMAFKQWRHYCEGSFHAIEILTNHNNLKGFMNVKALNGRQARWAISLSPYNFVISYRAGKTNSADTPSRRPDYKSENTVFSKLLPTLQQKLAVLGGLRSPIFGAINNSYIKDAVRGQEASDSITTMAIQSVSAGEALSNIKRAESRLVEALNSVIRSCRLPEVYSSRRVSRSERSGGEGEMPAHSKIDTIVNRSIGKVGYQLVPRTVVRLLALHKNIQNNEASISMTELIKALQEKNTFVHQRRMGETMDNRDAKAGSWSFDSKELLRCNSRLYVPSERSVQEEILRRYYDDPLAGYFGVDKTLDWVKKKFFWRTMPKDIKEYIDFCDICQRTKSKRHRSYGELQALPLSTVPWKQLAFDFITNLPPSKRRGCVYNTILVVVDRYTKMTRYILYTKKIKAIELVNLFWDEIALRYSKLESIVSDRGSLFTSLYWSDICYYSQIK